MPNKFTGIEHQIDCFKLRRFPFAPVGGRNVDPLLGFGVSPPINNATAWKHKDMWPVLVDDGQLKFEVKRRSRYGFPHSLLVQRETSPIFDLDHKGVRQT